MLWVVLSLEFEIIFHYAIFFIKVSDKEINYLYFVITSEMLEGGQVLVVLTETPCILVLEFRCM